MSRVSSAFERLSGAGVDAMIVSNPSNIRYLTGFTGSHGTVALVDGEAILFTDNRYAERAEDEIRAAGTTVQIAIAPGSAHRELCTVLSATERIGVEAAHVSWSEARVLSEALGEDRIVPTANIVEDLREFKSADELDLMRRAASIADQALAGLLEDFGPGPTEREVARHLDQLVLQAGAHGPGFETIVASGPNSSRPHHQPTDRRLSKHDLVIIDFGAQYGGYRSDMTRSFVLGEPSSRQQELLDGVRSGQEAGVAAVAPGVAASGIDDACRSYLDGVGLGEWFTHGTGHGVGLDIHEAPSVSAKGTATLAPGHVITVEPGAYIPDFGGVRWEDTVVVTASGAEPLTQSAKQPVVS